MVGMRFAVVFVALLGTACSGLLFLEQSKPCTSVGDCALGLVCFNGGCRPPNSEPCTPENPIGTCPNGKICDNGTCVGNVQNCCVCPAGQGCIDCACVDCDAGNRCSSANVTGCCPDGEVCVGGNCQIAECGTAGTGCCESGMTCVDSKCQMISDQPCDVSTGVGRCPAGHVCVVDAGCVQVGCDATHACGRCSPDQVCRNGACETLPCSPGHPSGTCSNGDICSVMGSCIPPGNCLDDLDCFTGNTFCSFCTSSLGTCAAVGSCSCAGDCGATSFCACNGQCAASGTCAGDCDCTTGPNTHCCSTNSCVQPGQCCTTSDCAPGYNCNTGNQTCELSGVPCTSNGSIDCPSDAQCAGYSTSTTCTNARCAWSGTCRGIADQLRCCPVGETCCPANERCDSSGFCAPMGVCSGNGDCLQPGYVCTGNQCVPSGTVCTGGCSGGCQGSCNSGELCSAGGACVPVDQCSTSADCPNGEFCNAQFQCEIYCGCGCTPYQSQLVPPNMLIVFDRSGSMNNCDTGGAPPTRWNVSRSALDTMMTANSGAIRFGLSTYPYYCPGSAIAGTTTGNSCSNTNSNDCNWNTRCTNPCSPNTNANACGRFPAVCTWNGSACVLAGTLASVCNLFPPCTWNGSNCVPDDPAIATGNNVTPGDVDVAVGDTTVAAISAYLAPPTGSVGAMHPGGYTPTGRTLRNIAAKVSQFGLNDTGRGNYVMLVTDGDANNPGGTYGVCDQGGMTAAEEVNCALDYMRGLSPAVSTFVVGNVGGSPANLNCHAVHGGTSRCGTDATCAGFTAQAMCESAGCSAYATQGPCEAVANCRWNTTPNPDRCEAKSGGCFWDTGPNPDVCVGVNTTNCGSVSALAGSCYYLANNGTELAAAFANIAGRVASCTYSITPAPPDWNRVAVYLDYASPPGPGCIGNPCRLDPGPGTWTANPAAGTVIFNDPICSTTVQAGNASPIIVVGCCVPGEGC